MKRTSELRVWTIGHSTRSLDEFIYLLSKNRIQAVADVRSLAGSRKFPHFNAEKLEISLPGHHVEYIQLKKLGGRRKVRADSQHTVWRNASFRGYADHMDTPEFEEGITELLNLAREKRTAVMCAEAVWWRCHRSMISDHLKSLGLTVEHIMDGAENVVHPYTSAARIEKGRLVYGE